MIKVGRVLVAMGVWSEMPMLGIFSDVVLWTISVVAKVWSMVLFLQVGKAWCGSGWVL